MNKIFLLLFFSSLLGAQTVTGNVQITGVVCVGSISGAVATPVDSPGAGTYGSAQTVTLSDSTSGATICYTVDGSTPTAVTAGICTNGTTYTTGFNVTVTTTVKAIGTKSGLTNSSELDSTYTITGGGGAATPILVPYIGATGNYALASPTPVMPFLNQGTATSRTRSFSISNCSGGYSQRCTGTGNLNVSSITITGTNASDFVLGGPSCLGTIFSGSDCEPTITFTPSASGSRSATLNVVTDAGTVTMGLTGTGATVTPITSSSSCASALSANTTYQFTTDISCTDIGFAIGATNVYLNLNGHTLTYGTGPQGTELNAVQMTSNGDVIHIYGGTVTKGSGTNSRGSSRPISSVFGHSGSNAIGDGSEFSDLTVNLNMQYANVIDVETGNFTAHELIVNDTGIGTCGTVGCRNLLQSAAIYQTSSYSRPANQTKVYDYTQNGGPQGGVELDAPGAELSYAYINPGNVTGTNTQDFSAFAWSGTANIHDNIFLVPLTAGSAARGVQISDAEGLGVGGKVVQHNYIQATDLPNNTEYSGCALGGTYGGQFDDSPPGTNTLENNTINVYAKSCPAIGLRATATSSSGNTSQNNVFTATRLSGATTCVTSTWTDAEPGCAYGTSIDGATNFSSTGDSFTSDSAAVFISTDGGSAIYYSPTFNKGSNPSAFHTFLAQNGPTSGGNLPGVIHVVDATFGSGVSPTDMQIYAQGANVGPASFYVDWTQNMTVTKASGPAASGATVTFTDTLSHTYTCTTNSSGLCSAVVTQYRDNNDSAANQTENRNPYSLSVSDSGCTTNTTTGITISATGSRSIVLSGC